MTARVRSTRVLLLLAGLVLVACGAPDSGLLPPPSSTASTSTSPTTAPVDYSEIALDAFPGQPTTTAPISAGNATIRGAVSGPEGGVVGGTVRIERLVADVVQRTDVPTNETGGFILSGVPGGRYRVRAFQAPTLAMTDVEIFFLEDGADKEIRLNIEAFEGTSVRASTTPANPIVGQGVNLAVRVAQRTVDGDGIGREAPLAGVAVRLRTSGWVVLDEQQATTTTTSTTTTTDPDDDDDDNDESEEDDDDPAPVGGSARVTDGDGVIVFQFACDRVGSTTATAIIGSGDDEQTFPLEVPPCSPVPTTTTTTTAPPVEDDTTTTTTP